MTDVSNNSVYTFLQNSVQSRVDSLTFQKKKSYSLDLLRENTALHHVDMTSHGFCSHRDPKQPHTARLSVTTFSCHIRTDRRGKCSMAHRSQTQEQRYRWTFFSLNDTCLRSSAENPAAQRCSRTSSMHSRGADSAYNSVLSTDGCCKHRTGERWR